MSSSERGKVWDHTLMVWVKPKTNKVIPIADIVKKASVLTEWNKASDTDKQQAVVSAYIFLRKTKKVRRWKEMEDGVEKKKSETLDPKKHGYDDSVLYVSYLVKKMTEYGCDKEEALSLWKKVKKMLQTRHKKAGKEFVDLDPNPPVVERVVKVAQKNKSIDDQLKDFFDGI